VRLDDVVVRWGGQEFLIVLRRTDPGYVKAFAGKLKAMVAGHSFHVQSEGAVEEAKLSVSVGFVQFPVYSERPAEVDMQQALEMAAKELARARAERE
jgi:diguanylate cyclase (GGDEF)-like protein